MTVLCTLVAESLRDDAIVAGVPLEVQAIVRVAAGDPNAGQPRIWTMLELEAPDDGLDDLVAQLTDALRPGPWYCAVRTADEIAVVFAGRVFRYHRGDVDAREVAQEYARSSGVPDGQLDWPD